MYKVAPRQMLTFEEPLKFTQPAGVVITHRNGNPCIGYVEALSAVAGFTDLNALRAVAPLTFDSGIFRLRQINYGERISEQLPTLIDTLRNDIYTREAVLIIANGEDKPGLRPCPETFQVIFREGHYHGYLHMRSLDVVRGLPNDFVIWGVMLQVIANCMHGKAGDLTIYSPLAHIYEQHLGLKLYRRGLIQIGYQTEWELQDYAVSARNQLNETLAWSTPSNSDRTLWAPETFNVTLLRMRDVLKQYTEALKREHIKLDS